MIKLQTFPFKNTIFLHPIFLPKPFKNLPSFPLCKSTPKDDSSNSNPQDNSKPEGDPKQQELLAKIAMLQAQKLRLTDYLDERSSFLTQFAEDANAEFDAIGENALKDLDEASARIMDNIESKMLEFQETSELNKEEIAKRDQELAEFEEKIERGRNEGLFFKSLKDKKKQESVDKVKVLEEANKVVDVTKESIGGSKTRRNIYIGLMGVVGVFIVECYIDDFVDWRKIAVLGAIFVGLLTQFVYEQNLLNQNQGKDDDK